MKTPHNGLHPDQDDRLLMGSSDSIIHDLRGRFEANWSLGYYEIFPGSEADEVSVFRRLKNYVVRLALSCSTSWIGPSVNSEISPYLSYDGCFAETFAYSVSSCFFFSAFCLLSLSTASTNAVLLLMSSPIHSPIFYHTCPLEQDRKDHASIVLKAYRFDCLHWYTEYENHHLTAFLSF